MQIEVHQISVPGAPESLLGFLAMNELRKPEAWFTLSATLFSILASVETFMKLPLLLRIPVVGLFEMVGLVAVALWCSPRKVRQPGFQPPTATVRSLARSVRIFALVLLASASAGLLGAVLLRIAVRYHAMTIDARTAGRFQRIEIMPPEADAVRTCDIVLPATEPRCRPFDPTPDFAHVSLVDWGGPNPLLHIDDFRAPGVIGLRCQPPIDITRLHPGSTCSVEVLLPLRLREFRNSITGYGGVLCVVAFFVASLRWLRSSPSSP
jgi:hypothetical protein